LDFEIERSKEERIDDLFDGGAAFQPRYVLKKRVMDLYIIKPMPSLGTKK
jgi:hypothetical protein